MANQQIQNICLDIIENTKNGVEIWAQKLYSASAADDREAASLAFENLEQSVSTLVHLVNGLVASENGKWC